MAIKLILDTDIGTDVDDAWALALCLASEEIDLLGVTLVHADLDVRANIALKMLKLAGRTDVPVYRGLSRTLVPDGEYIWAGHEGTDTDFSDISGLSARDGAVDFILDTVEANPGEVVICPIGPLTNIGEAIRRNPEVMRKVRKLAIMGTTYAGEGPDAAEREHNGWVDPVATKLVLESKIPATVVGLNVTTKVSVRREDVKKLEGSPLGNYLTAMTYQYYGLIGRDYTYMHDPLAVAAVFDPEVVSTRRMSAHVLDDGRAAYLTDPEGWLDVCVGVFPERFEKLLLETIGSFIKKGDR